MDKNKFKVFDLIEEDLLLVEQVMLEKHPASHPDIETALHHLLSSGGKRVRPAVLILFARMFNASREQAASMAAAIELLHNATLVHDDFIDGALLRRGAPTLNAHWSPGATVLTGDYIFAKAAHLASVSGSIDHMRLFARALMTIVVGEVSQLFPKNGHEMESLYYERIHAKTASLFTLSSEVGARLGTIPEDLIENVRTYGTSIGEAFQIIDDILDFSSEVEKLGKPVGEDLRRGIITLPAIYYFESHGDDQSACTFLSQKELPEPEMDGLISAIQKSDSLSLAYKQARNIANRGIESLSRLPDVPEKDALIDLANYIVDRCN